ncbi:hypothetical protein TVAG_058440 [Trichomonas vaginalis G3]|uniref:Uncharacterized protein n=1 Tax=Trichomonas vaginalis (strain ATCC PRA-98 / G3) TaxID=412133 RepID=A2EQA4_TRIV3|nr:hypothetical protein TVAGG3_0586820 [Trichomonas vaginalis G3]EAY05187.1 hypothetical protein TVAG_058440 [Trichomonas vaginalis G3]KAI5522957.1 hypothetical protein TVAGG3_0586820 [Trichomonas vaginalis G3]|eukprot:XP_001317410.1 hypothetical protein [Trichomonas vaginalis G3]
MDSVVDKLQNGIQEGNELLRDIKNNVGNDDIRQFEQAANEYVDLYTKAKLYETLQQDKTIQPFKKSELDQARDQRQKIEQELQKIQNDRVRNEMTADEFQTLISQSNSILKQLKDKIPSSNTTDYNRLVEICDKEITDLKKSSAEYEWYENAYNKLSEFTNIEVISENKYRLKKKYILNIYQTKVELEKKDVFVSDISPDEDSIGVCIAQVMERLNAYEKITAAANRLGWSCEPARDSPFAILINESGCPARVSLFGNNYDVLLQMDDSSDDRFDRMKGKWRV